MRHGIYSEAGRNSDKSPKENQDCAYCGVFPLDYQVGEGYFMVVADGIGGKTQGKIGANGLAKALLQVLKTKPFVLTGGNHGVFLAELQAEWRKQCGKYHPNDCGSTALISVVEGENVHLFRLGDGFLAGVWMGETHVLMEDKSREGKFLNETECLGEDHIFGLWDCRKYPRQGLRGLVACTDGIELGEQSIYDYEAFAQEFIKNIFPKDKYTAEMKEIVQLQQNRDDKTIAVLLEEISTWRGYLEQSPVIYDAFGGVHQCTELLSQGGQGVVYRTKQPNIALKIAFDSQGEQDILNLEKNQVYRGIRAMPLPSPLTMPQVVLADYVGYTMELLEDMDSFDQCFSLFGAEYTGGDWFLEQHKAQSQLVGQLHNYKITGGLQRRLLAYYKLAGIFVQLHSRGLVFGDFSPKNVFFSRNHLFSHVWLIDVDNVDFERNHQRKLGYYTPRFVAPEVAKKEKGSSAYSDDYSFALSLFTQLTGSHPFSVEEVNSLENFESLEDYIENPQLKQRDQGAFPFLLAESDSLIPSDMILSPTLLTLFHRSFSTEGKEKRITRATALEWQKALGEALDTAIRCPHCAMDYHWEGHKDICPWCDNQVKLFRVDSFLSSTGQKLSTFVQARGGEISLPLRLTPVHGEGILAVAEEKGGELFLTQLHPSFDFSILDATGQWGERHRNFALKEDKFTLACGNKEAQYHLEVAIL